jgi:hypothetical protein
MRVAGLALALTLVGACASAGAPNSSAPVERAAQELDILEAVFRYQFDHNASGHRLTEFDYLFLSLANERSLPKDPPASLLARFKEYVPPVEPASGADIHARSGVHHKQTGGRGILFFLTNIRWIDDNTVEVDGGYRSGCVSDDTYRAERRDGMWVVVNDDLHWIS